MNFGVDDMRNLIEILKKDKKWLCRRKLLDYSLLIGVEKIEYNGTRSEETVNPFSKELI